MSRYLYLLLFATLLAFSGAAIGDEGVSQMLAQAPGHGTDHLIAPCLTQDISTLSLASDFSAYMAASCPSEVRNMALRHLWKLMPPANGPDREFGERQ